jgi:hypothetical protein
MWEIIHEESITATENLSIWYKETENLDKSILFEVNRRGLTVTYYHTAFDALDDRFPAAAICYGWDVIQMESREKNGFLNRVGDSDDIANAITCSHDFACEEIFHAAQVILGNEECEGCEPCSRYGNKEVA